MESPQQKFLPDFCANQSVFLLVLIAELLAFILAFAATDTFSAFWTELALSSLFIQWVALGTAAVLCCCRPLIARLNAKAATLLAYGLAQLVTLLSSFIGIWILETTGNPMTENVFLAHAYTIFRNIAISSIVSLVALRYFYIQNQWKQKLEAEARARWQALQARIRPHFLFNSMNTIANLTRSNPEQAEEAILDLADIFRFTLEQKDRISLREELEITRRYLHIEALRLGERLRVEWRLGDELPLDMPIPMLILQPLVENAIYHGIQPLTHGGCVTIGISSDAEALRCTIVNPLALDVPDHRHSNQIAQDNIRQRLTLAYGRNGMMTINETDDTYEVQVTIPRETP